MENITNCCQNTNVCNTFVSGDKMYRMASLCSLVIMFFGLPLAHAVGFEVDTEIKVSQSEKLIIMSSPSLHRKKVSQVKISYVGTKSFELLAFDAEMPDHNHGMIVKPTKPKPEPGDKNTYSLEGVKLHMPGSWVLIVSTKIDGKIKEFRHLFKAKP